MFKDTTSESTGRLVLEAIDALGVTLTPAMATPLFAAIATDTGWFRFASVSEATFAAAARLVAAGAEPHVVFAALYEQNSLARLLLQGRILSNVKSHLGGRLLSTAITQADLQCSRRRSRPTRKTSSTGCSAWRASKSRCCSSSLGRRRRRSACEAARRSMFTQIAEQFGGGGHRAAAGVRFPGPLAEAQNRRARCRRARDATSRSMTRESR